MLPESDPKFSAKSSVLQLLLFQLNLDLNLKM